LETAYLRGEWFEDEVELIDGSVADDCLVVIYLQWHGGWTLVGLYSEVAFYVQALVCGQ
jgi:hypothetical protein